MTVFLIPNARGISKLKLSVSHSVKGEPHRQNGERNSDCRRALRLYRCFGRAEVEVF